MKIWWGNFFLALGLAGAIAFNLHTAYKVWTHPDIRYVVVAPDTRTALWEAICEVESNSNPSAFNATDPGGARGIAQITPVMVEDVNRILGQDRFTLEDCFSVIRSRQMFDIYVENYFPNGTDEEIARGWNGGPKGPIKKSTLEYWHKVKSVLESQ